MDVRKMWDTNNEENSEYKSVCDVYGAEHLARLISMLVLGLAFPGGKSR